MTDREIADRSGLRVDQVIGLSWLCTWENVPVDVMQSFVKACGIDFDDYSTMHKHYRFVSRMSGRWFTGKHYLRRDDDWELKWKPLLENYVSYLQCQDSSKR